jgi:zinc transport system substrate-binding protein
VLRLFALACLLAIHAVNASPRVAATIEPLHSIAASIMQGAGEPGLILDNGISPHHTSLRPSQRRMVAQADILFWVSPTLETFMPRLLASATGKQQSIELIHAPGVNTLPARHHHPPLTNSETAAEPLTHPAENGSTDPHIWLSPDNVRAIARAMTDTLARTDPSNAARYRANLAATLARIDTLDRHIQEQLKGPLSPYFSYHDAYRYFEHSYGLEYIDSITTISDAGPGTRHVHDVREQIIASAPACLFYDAPAAPSLVRMLVSGTPTRAVELDPLGIRQPPGRDAWFDIMKSLAAAFAGCLQSRESGD